MEDIIIHEQIVSCYICGDSEGVLTHYKGEEDSAWAHSECADEFHSKQIQ